MSTGNTAQHSFYLSQISSEYATPNVPFEHKDNFYLETIKNQ